MIATEVLKSKIFYMEVLTVVGETPFESIANMIMSTPTLKGLYTVKNIAFSFQQSGKECFCPVLTTTNRFKVVKVEQWLLLIDKIRVVFSGDLKCHENKTNILLRHYTTC